MRRNNDAEDGKTHKDEAVIHDPRNIEFIPRLCPKPKRIEVF